MTPTPAPLAPLAPDTLARLTRVSTATLCTRLFKAGFRSVFLAGLKPVGPAARMVGPAVTVPANMNRNST